MKVPVAYSLRNLSTRKLTTALTAGGMAMVVFVFATVLMLEQGLRDTLVDTGAYDNAVVIRRSAQTEVQSGVERAQAGVIESQPEVAVVAGGVRMLSKEAVVLVNLYKRGAESRPANVIVRGTAQAGIALRPNLRVIQGRMFRPGVSEIIVGKSIAERFRGAGIGEGLYFGLRDWTVVGVFDTGGSGFDSEIWGDADQLMQAFRRVAYSSVVLKLTDAGGFDALKQRLEADQRLTVEVKRERQFYADQSALLANFIRYLGLSLSITFSIGAVIGAMITMYAAVATRTAEIGTLRALGFRSRSILAAFLLESVLLGLVGGLAGLGLASAMQLVTLSTMNWQSFSELAFSFVLTARIGVQSLLFALAMGFIGGFLPAWRAARLNIVDALRAI
jgi:ABC-type antimicrobial peptide transport system permease subunit